MCGTTHDGTAADCPEQRAGETVAGKYVLEKLLGVGGMAAVYAAEHVVLRRRTAIKVLHKRFVTDAELGARFLREARETARVGHPAFVAVHDAGTTEDGCAYIEMDRLDGRDLYSIRKAEGALPVERVVEIAKAVLDALVALHARGVVHRDLKSANVFLAIDERGEEQVRILDLGFAKVEDEVSMTSPEALLGTPFYISPEQYFDPRSVDARADLFSLGIVMFELLVGGWPYTYASKRELLHKVMTGDLERHPMRRRAEVPAWLDAIVARALALERADRFASATAMREAMEHGEAPPKRGFFRRVFGL